jgi:GAF domain-containing protein
MHFKNIEVPDHIMDEWQGTVDMVAKLVDVPAGLIMRIVDEDIQVFLASRNPENPYNPGDREHLPGSGLYCETVIKTGRSLCVPDALADPDWKNNPDVKLGMISYLGFPIYYPDRKPFGTICILDKKANPYSKTIRGLLEKLRHLVETQLHLLCMNAALGDSNKEMRDYLDELQALRGIVTICAGCKKVREQDGSWKPVEKYLVRHPHTDFSHSYCPACYEKAMEGKDLP